MHDGDMCGSDDDRCAGMEAGRRMDGPTCSIDNLLTMSIVMLYEH